jgi:hypothetical protein
MATFAMLDKHGPDFLLEKRNTFVIGSKAC